MSSRDSLNPTDLTEDADNSPGSAVAEADSEMFPAWVMLHILQILVAFRKSSFCRQIFRHKHKLCLAKVSALTSWKLALNKCSWLTKSRLRSLLLLNWVWYMNYCDIQQPTENTVIIPMFSCQVTKIRFLYSWKMWRASPVFVINI